MFTSDGPNTIGKVPSLLKLRCNVGPFFECGKKLEVPWRKILLYGLTHLIDNVRNCRLWDSELEAQGSVSLASGKKSYCQCQSLSSTNILVTTSYLTRGYVRLNKPQYLEKIVMNHSHHFAVTWSIFDHQFLHDIIEVSFLFSSPYPAPGLLSSTFPFSILL